MRNPSQRQVSKARIERIPWPGCGLSRWRSCRILACPAWRPLGRHTFDFGPFCTEPCVWQAWQRIDDPSGEVVYWVQWLKKMCHWMYFFVKSYKQLNLQPYDQPATWDSLNSVLFSVSWEAMQTKAGTPYYVAPQVWLRMWKRFIRRSTSVLERLQEIRLTNQRKGAWLCTARSCKDTTITFVTFGAVALSCNLAEPVKRFFLAKPAWFLLRVSLELFS